MEIPYAVEPHPITGVSNGKLGIWLFLASEVMLFGGLFSAYILLRNGAPEWPDGSARLYVGWATLNTVVLIASSVTVVMAWSALKMNNFNKCTTYLCLTVALALCFMLIKGIEYSLKFSHGIFPKTDVFYAIYFTMTGLHAIHILGGVAVFMYLMATGGEMWKKDPERFTGRVEITGLYWHFVDLVWIFLFPSLYLI